MLSGKPCFWAYSRGELMSWEEHPGLLLGEIIFYVLVAYVVYRIGKRFYRARKRKDK